MAANPSTANAAGNRQSSRTADFACRLCAGRGLYLYYTLGGRSQFEYYKCPTCKLVNYDLRGGIDQEQYAEFVDPCDDNAPRNLDKDATWRFIEKHVPGRGRFLDIGSGTGRLLYLAKRAGSTVNGLELSAPMADLARQRVGVEIIVADFLEFDAPPVDRYDLVSLRHVLEHLPDSLLAMKKINRLLKLGGHALLEFPNIEAADKRFKRFLVDRGFHQRRFADSFRPGHCNEFCKASFAYLVAKTGFTLVRWETYSAKPLANFIYNRIHIGNKARALIRKHREQ